MRVGLWHEGGLGDVIDAAHLAVALRQARPQINFLCYYLRKPVQNDLVFCLEYNGKPIFDATIRTAVAWEGCVQSEAPHWDHFIDWRPYVAMEYESYFQDPRSSVRWYEPLNRALPDDWQDCYRDMFDSAALNRLQFEKKTLHEIACVCLDIPPVPVTSLTFKTKAPIRWQTRWATREPYITLGPGSDTQRGARERQTKEWPDFRWAEVIRILRQHMPGVRILQVGKAGETSIPGATSLIGKTSIPELLHVLQHSRLHLGCENGTVRIASAAGVKCVVVFGPTSPHLYGFRSNINITSEACVPCYWREHNWMVQCPNDWGCLCMACIKSEEVAEAAVAELQARAPAELQARAPAELQGDNQPSA